ncbi:hypothetical protein [Aeromonas phage Asp37]|nr:hypothetical protein [Aeromonas phage Asp37]
MTNLTKAQSQAAQECLTILTDAKLIGSDLLTKMAECRTAILETLPKAYQSINAVEESTGENLDKVRNAVTNMYGRGKWADHDAMMNMVEGALESFIQEHMETVGEAEAATTEQSLTEKAVALAHSTIEGMTKRIVELHTALETTEPGTLNSFVISHESKLVTYQWVEGVWRPARDIFNMPLYSSIEATREDAIDCVRSRGHRVVICQLSEVVHAILMNSQMMIDQCSTFLSQQREPIVSELWQAQQDSEAGEQA